MILTCLDISAAFFYDKVDALNNILKFESVSLSKTEVLKIINPDYTFIHQIIMNDMVELYRLFIKHDIDTKNLDLYISLYEPRKITIERRVIAKKILVNPRNIYRDLENYLISYIGI